MFHTEPQNVENVAAYILASRSPLPTMKLHTLLYYAQVHSLKQYDVSLFHNRMEAWSGNPVIPELFEQHVSKFMINNGDISGDTEALNAQQRKVINDVLDKYGNLSGDELRELSRTEIPWINARKGYTHDTRVGGIITADAIRACL